MFVPVAMYAAVAQDPSDTVALKASSGRRTTFVSTIEQHQHHAVLYHRGDLYDKVVCDDQAHLHGRRGAALLTLATSTAVVNFYGRRGAASLTPGAPAIVFHGRRGAAWLTLAASTAVLNFHGRRGAALLTPGALTSYLYE